MRIFSFLLGFVNPPDLCPPVAFRVLMFVKSCLQSHSSLFESEATVCQTDTYQLAMSISVSLQMVVFLSYCLPSVLGQEDCCSFTIFVLF